MNFFDDLRAKNKNTLNKMEKAERQQRVKKKTPQQIPQNTQKKSGKTTRKTTLPKKQGSNGNHTARDGGVKSRKLSAGARAVQQNEIKTNPIPQAMLRFNERVLNDGALAPISIPYQIATGKKLLNFGLQAETDSARKGAAVGNFIGTAAAYGMGYGAADKAIGKGAAKLLSGNAGKKATTKIIGSKLGQKAGKEAAEKVAEGLARNLVGDATVGTLMNLSAARGEGLQGKELAKDMAVNAAFDAVLGTGFELAPMALKAGKNALKNTKIEPRIVDGKVKNVRVRQQIPQNTAYRVSRSRSVNERIDAKLVNEELGEIPRNVQNTPQPIPYAQEKAGSSYISPEIVPEEKGRAYHEYIESASEDTKKFVENVRTGKISKKAYRKMGGVAPRESAAIKQITGIDTREYEHILPANAVEHIDKRHGKNGLSDQSMANLNDVSRMEYVIHNFDEVELLKNSDGTAATTGAMQGTDQKAAQLIRYKKRIDGHYYIVEAVAENKKKQLRVISAYIEKAGNDMPAGRATRPEHAANLPPQVTSETPNAMSASYHIIPENSGNVKQTPQPIPHADTIPKKRKVASESPEITTDERWDYMLETAPGERHARKLTEEEWTSPKKHADDKFKAEHGITDRQAEAFYSEPRTEIKESKKAQQYERRQVREADKAIREALDINKYSDGPYIKKRMDETVEKMKNGSLSKAEKEQLFDDMFANGIKIDSEFATQYQDLKKVLRETPIKVSENIKKNIADFGDFRRRNVNKIRLNDQEGVQADIFYDELRNTYPELFPEVNTPEEMVEKIAEVADSIKIAEKRVSEDIFADEIYTEAKKRFEEVMDNLENEVNIVKKNSEKHRSDITIDQMHEFITDLGKFKREAEKVKSEVILSDGDRKLKDMLLEGQMTPETLRKFNLNASNIIEVYEAEKPVFEMKNALTKLGDKTKEGYREAARRILEGSENWKDKRRGFRYDRETPERNFVDIAGKEAGERINREFITPIHEHEAAATRMKNELRGEVKNLKISSKRAYDLSRIAIEAPGLDEKQKVTEATLVQLYGEKLIRKEDLEFLGADVAKIENAVQTLRGIYNQLIEKANNELIRHGYEPIEFRKDYFPHFSEDKSDGMIAKIGSYLGINVKKDELPTDIIGLTHMFKPGRKWFGNALQRTGKTTEYNAVKGFDIYIEGVADIIYHTEDIQKLRALESELRFKYSDDGIKKRIKEIKEKGLSREDEEKQILDILRVGNTKLGGLAVWLQDYTNQLAGKKPLSDRIAEAKIGRTYYNATKAIESRIAANMVALNPGSWLTNFIPLVQAGELSPKYVIEGIAQTVGNRFKKVDDITDISSFLTNRKGSNVLWKSKLEKAQDFLTSPMQMIDDFTSEALVRAKYAEQLKKGVHPEEAIKTADRFAADIIADRSKGALPITFNQKSPIKKILTMYQVEVNNQWSHLLKDIPRSKENVAQVALAFTNFAVGAYIFNDVYERIVGRRSALDPISWVNDFAGDVTGKKLPNFTEALEKAMKGQGISLEEADTKSGGGTIASLGENVAQDIPFVGGLLGGGRVPISSALPNVATVATNVGNLITGDVDSKKGLSAIGKELAKPATYIIPPVGGGQIKKATESTRALIKGGTYGLDKDGQEQLKFAVDKTGGDIAKGILFGQYAIGNSGDYVDSGFKMLSAKKTRAYKALKETGMKNTEAENFIRSLPSGTTDMRNAIMNSNLTAKQKNAVGRILDENSPDYTSKDSFAYSQMSDGERKVIKALTKTGMTQAKASRVYNAQKDYSANIAKVDALLEEGYHEGVMKALGLSETAVAKGKALHNAGLSADAYVYTRKHADLDGNGGIKKDELIKYLNGTAYDRSQKFALYKAIMNCKDKNNPYR